MLKLLRLVGVMALATVAFVVGITAASAADEWAPNPWYTVPGSLMPGGGTGWTGGPVQFWLPGVDGGGSSIRLSEVYWPNPSLSFPRFNILRQGQKGNDTNGTLEARGFYICELPDGSGSLRPPRQFATGGSSLNAQGTVGSDPPGTWGLELDVPMLQTSVAGGNCSSGYVVTGLRVQFTHWSGTAVGTGFAMRQWWMEWQRGRYVPPEVSPEWCESFFGVGYDPDAVYEVPVLGGPVTPRSVGCTGGDGDGDPWDEWDPWTDFDTVCADPPEVGWGSLDNIGPWIGHYATCLFVPGYGWRSDWVRYAADGGPIGQVQSLGQELEPLAGVRGECGPIGTGNFYGTTLTIDTCEGADRWATVRQFIGIGILAMAAIGGINGIILGATGKPATFGEGRGEK